MLHYISILHQVKIYVIIFIKEKQYGRHKQEIGAYPLLEFNFLVLFVYTVYMCVFYFVPYPKAIWVGVIGGVVALMFAAVKTYAIMNIKPEDTKMQEIETCADRTVKPLLLHKFAMFFSPRFIIFANLEIYKYTNRNMLCMRQYLFNICRICRREYYKRSEF
jgi:hypothetical protein